MRTLTYAHLSDDAKQQICAWKYGGDYAIYNLPSYADMQAQHRGFMNPEAEQDYYGFWDEDALVGYIKLTEMGTAVAIGIGVKPELCNKGYGQQIIGIAAAISGQLYPSKPLCLEVRTWNTRAIRCYEKAGFQIDGPAYELTTGIGVGMFYRMTSSRSAEYAD